MNIIKIAAFSDGNHGGNPAGVVLTETMPSELAMQNTAADVGFSETVFAQMLDDKTTWRVRYFSPESEVPFCGHATIALGSALAQKHGDGNYYLSLNDADISVEGSRVEGSNGEDSYLAALKSPRTSSTTLSAAEIDKTLELFGYEHSDLADNISPAHISGGADHYVIVLNKRAALSAMSYDIDAGRAFMRERNIVTVMFVFSESNQLFHVRNAFASGGVLEDPATGAAAAAFSGYLRDISWPGNGKLTLIQGEDMGSRSIITTEFSSETGSSITVSGASRYLE